MPACETRLALITDRLVCPEPLLDRVARLLAAGVGTVILREKDLPEPELLTLAGKIQKIASLTGARLIVNSSLTVAAAVNAYGLQLPFAAFNANPQLIALARAKNLLTSVSVHSLPEAALAIKAGADGLLAGPIFPTDCKPGREPLNLTFVAELVAVFKKPVFVVGGLGPDNVALARQAGAAGVALRSGLLTAPDPEQYVHKCLLAINNPFK
ncbi:MAG: thiamine phosphate synthase [Deltaproteobacteria bacterium]|jgi:thiamine-phosphate pyrophosphorylase|nr:thiamine phosphate synthase [Deltaproteobacteria bacterium]